MLRAGWNPPAPNDKQAGRILHDIERVGNASLDLSPRELEVLTLFAHGGTAPTVAAQLGVTVSTVREHTREIRRRMGVDTTAHAVALAVADGLIRVEDTT